MRRVKSIRDFIYCTQFGIVGRNQTPSEVFFDSKNIGNDKDEIPELFIQINLENNESVKFGIVSNDIDTKRFAFNNIYFSNDEIIELSKLFEFEFTKNPFYPDKLQGSLSFIHKNYKNIYPVIKENHNKIYLLIYASRRSSSSRSLSEDFYSDDIFYIHGIWEVELSNKNKERLIK